MGWRYGASGADTLNGGGVDGHDYIAGGPGLDVLFFGPGDDLNEIADFSPGSDRLDITGFGLTFQQAKDAASDEADGARFDFEAGDQIKLYGVEIAALSPGDLI